MPSRFRRLSRSRDAGGEQAPESPGGTVATGDEPARQPLGEGPIEQTVRLVVAGRLPLADARRRVTEPDVVRALSQAYVDALADLAEEWARGPGHRGVVLLADLVVAATEAARRNGGGDAAAEAMAAAGIAMYVEVARVDLGDVPDGRVYRRALALGRELEARARAAGDRKMLGTILHRLGTLNLDPFIAGRSSEAYADSEPVARANLAAALGDAIASIDPAELALPVPLEALRLAEDYLRQAAELRTGDPRARSLKAQGEAMVWRKLLGDPMDDDAIAVVLEQALKELDWDADPQMRLTTLNGLRVLGRPVAGGVERVFERSLDEWARGLGERGARDLVMQACALLRAERPRDALRLLAEARPLSDALGEETRLAHLRAEITMLSELGGDEPPAPGPGELFDAVLELQRRANADRWDIERVFGRVVGLVAASPEHDEEEAALELFEQARALAPLLAGRHAPALDWLNATLLMGTGVNGFRRHDWRAGIAGYAQALAAFLEIGMPGAAQDCLARIVDLSEQPAPDASQAVAAVAGIGPSALQAERVIGRAAAAHIRRAAENVLGDTRGGMGSAEELLAMQMAKGLRFSTALYSGSRYRREEDAVGRDLLEAIAETEAEVVGERSAWAPVDDDVLLTDYTESERFSPDDAPPQTPPERLSWLCRRYDAHLWNALLEGADAADALWLRLEDIQAALDDRTALVSFFLGTRAPDGSTAGKVLVVTRRHVRSHLLPDAVPELGQSPAHRIAATRRLVQANAGPRDVCREGAVALEADFHAFLADGAILDGLRDDGIDHLCVVPHRPLHYHPLHLTGTGGATLADDWIVTYLPNLHLFVSRRGQPAARRHRAAELTAIGLGFEAANPHGLTPLGGAVEEAAAVARTYGSSSVPEQEATEARAADALEGSRFVHLATHGRHDAAAPAFQCLYLTPDGDSDGRLRAHELLALELRGLDLVTLSACETALGRVDGSDNPRGLPAALLLAGASTLIGTLWEVEDGASRRFFTALYERLRAEESCLDAFRGAQLDTRADYPQYRDWGAFYLVGEWEW